LLVKFIEDFLEKGAEKSIWRGELTERKQLYNDDEVSVSHSDVYENDYSEMLPLVVWSKFTDVSEVLVASIIRVP
jgi:hypothetical protein